ncbi:hypothetical protein LSH36_354g00004 [Paralvinella palmiformis]|uniref:G-protein coupled receptors family 1 profile domain-containing protein n=1 Tax=Paralvinella palmiformis TaxID=53620 RepID=A0AAD9MZL9_9ANNE|nr:hypothetical protein LSH36_354g00004 [Paralvinella palmiformis]
MVCFCMWKTKSLRTPVNNLILNMAIVGIMSSVTCLPLKVVIIAYEGLGHHFIRIEAIFIFFVVLHSLNLLTLASISFERYQAIAKPFEKTKRSRRVRVTLLITWLIATVRLIIQHINMTTNKLPTNKVVPSPEVQTSVENSVLMLRNLDEPSTTKESSQISTTSEGRSPFGHIG